MLRGLYVRGEISNFKAYPSGHYYFTVKDESSLLRAVMFRSNAQRLGFLPENGMKVTVHGSVSVYPRDGQYQLYADGIEPDGIGALYTAYEQLKAKLAAEGLFDPARKRPLPRFPLRVGVITSPSGAAIRDVINVTGRRFPLAELVIYPAAVQGFEAVPQLIAGVEYFNLRDRADLLIIGRGGGSLEDLWAFNNEDLARAIAASHIPVISAVGHETDFTICDFVADMRAPTPSAAAELAVPDASELRSEIAYCLIAADRAVDTKITELRRAVSRLEGSAVMTDPQALIDGRRMRTDRLSERLSVLANRGISDGRAEVREYAAKLSALNPLAILSRGYGAVTDAMGRIVTRAADVAPNDDITVRFSDGELRATVRGKTIYEGQDNEG